MYALYLASTSRYRRRLLERLDVPFTCLSPACDETNEQALPPLELACALARRKAESLRQHIAAAENLRPLIIGSDQVVALDGEILGKPGSAAVAEVQLRRLRGRMHRLITAVAVHDVVANQTFSDVDVHELTMRPLTDLEIHQYVAHDQPFDCAGSYKLEVRGIALFDRLQADADLADSTAVEGLPLAKLCRLLRQRGVDVLQL